MEERTKRAIKLLVGAIESNDQGDPTYSGSENLKIRDCLLPEVIEAINIEPDSLRISEAKLKNRIDDALLSAKNAEDEVAHFTSELDPIKDEISAIGVEEHIVGFPLNFDRLSDDLLEDELRIGEIRFNNVDSGTWKSDFIPNFDESSGKKEVELHSPEYYRRKLQEFLNSSPNDLYHHRATYWSASVFARDHRYAVQSVIDSLSILLGELNFAMKFNQSENINFRSGPWPARLSDLRQPFIYLIYDENMNFQNFYYDDEDGTPRNVVSPHSIREESFKEMFQFTPDFAEEQPLDGYLKKAFTAYQSAVTNPSQREAFFELWRAIEILSLKKPNQRSKVAIERAEAIFDWNNPELTELRTQRAVRKRNEYVHDGHDSEITIQDKNMLKQLLDGLIDFYIERRGEWNVDQMRYCLSKFTVDSGRINHLEQDNKEELEVLEWLDEMAQEYH